MTTGMHLSDELAQRHLDGILSGAAADEVEEHLAACSGCRALLKSYRALSQALDALVPAEPPTDFTAGVLARIAARERSAARERRLALGILAGVGAAAAVLFVVAGQGAWAPLLSRWSSALVGATAALRIGSDVIDPLVRALRAEIALACAVLGLPLLVAMRRLVASRGTELA
jgi:predicted anti-sigma-YlaC factor YlaD